nr:immunoglobulin heavy chain junction region [Macaca mulatta]MOV47763.1 immunoglobulin heavy chain junction region [Macaca mulatta]MOV48345.1 immunoglobulin heavy chain junction region [Macaca mulatta]
CTRGPIVSATSYAPENFKFW